MGQVIAGRFELLDHIGSGTSGAVWRAFDRRLGHDCAAKVLRQKDSGELLRFAREQGVRLDHPHLVTPYGWAAEDDDVAIAMPLVRGGTLDAHLRADGALSPELTATILLQLLEGLRHVHDAGWMHRDVKPANVLLEPTGHGRPHARLADFGTALREDEPRFTEMGFVHGTPGYLPPEALRGSGPSPAQDLYALGIVGIRMLNPAVKGDEALRWARATLPHSSLPSPLADAVLGLTDDDPSARHAAAAQAPTLLAPATRATSYRFASGAPFEVRDQLPTTRPSEIASGAATVPSPPQAPQGVAALTHTVVRPARRPGHASPRGPVVMVSAGLALLVAAVVVALL